MSAQKLKIRKGDQVVVISGANKGAKGEVTKVIPETSRVIVQGVNMVKKHKKPSQTSAGGIETMEAPLHISNVSLIDPKSDKPTRAGYKIAKDGTKTRIARRSGDELPVSK